MMLLDTPPGQHPTRSRPIVMALLYGAKAGTRLNNHDRVKAIRGIKVYCAAAPIRISKGLEKRILKSLVVSVKPIVSMINPKIRVCMFPFTHAKRPGKKKATMAAATTNKEACPDSNSLNFLKAVYNMMDPFLISKRMRL